METAAEKTDYNLEVCYRVSLQSDGFLRSWKCLLPALLCHWSLALKLWVMILPQSGVTYSHFCPWELLLKCFNWNISSSLLLPTDTSRWVGGLWEDWSLSHNFVDSIFKYHDNGDDNNEDDEDNRNLQPKLTCSWSLQVQWKSSRLKGAEHYWG